MRYSFLIFLGAFITLTLSSQELPPAIYVGGQSQHVQGIALDREAGYMYMSFTNRFIKADLQGNIVASIDRIQGHLGAMCFNPENRMVYASLECKDDEIGAGIAKALGTETVSRSGCVFYIAIIDVDKLTDVGVDPEGSDVLRTVCVKEAGADYKAVVSIDGKEYEHKYGCSGIDGVTIAPPVGKPGGKSMLYVAYGVYSDVERTDNDYQVLLCYDLGKLDRYAETITFGTVPENGPSKPKAKYFVRTGNTNWGVQNLSYDSHTGNVFMAVYRGKKAEWPNYYLYAFPLDQKPTKGVLVGMGYDNTKHPLLSLAAEGLLDEATGVRGWNFKWGSTGLCPLGNGMWYISENARDKQTGLESCTARLYRWSGEPARAFVPVE